MTALWHSALDMVANKSMVVLSGVIGVSNFVVADVLTNDKAYAFLLCVLSTMATAYFTSRPRVIAALAAREATHASIEEQAKEMLIKRMGDLHREQLLYNEREMAKRDAEIKFVRISKHNAIDAIHAAYMYLDDVREIALQAGLSLPDFQKVRMVDIFREEDEILRIAATEELSKPKI